MDALWVAISWVARVFAWIGGAMIMVAALIVSTEVISRKLLALPFSGSDEIGAYLFAIGTSWSMAFVLVTRGHVRIDALYGSFSPFVRAILDFAAPSASPSSSSPSRTAPGSWSPTISRAGTAPTLPCASPALPAVAVVLRLRAVPRCHSHRRLARVDRAGAR
jgi:ABC-type sulfate transport system permease subunit